MRFPVVLSGYPAVLLQEAVTVENFHQGAGSCSSTGGFERQAINPMEVR